MGEVEPLYNTLLSRLVGVLVILEGLLSLFHVDVPFSSNEKFIIVVQGLLY